MEIMGLAMTDMENIWVAGQFGVILKSEATPAAVKTVATNTLPDRIELS
jgi:hypothetical protein